MASAVSAGRQQECHGKAYKVRDVMACRISSSSVVELVTKDFLGQKVGEKGNWISV